MGIGMAMAHDHSIMPAHAHLNLLGWVSLFLFGIYYKLNPALERSRLALVQVVVWSIGTVVLTFAVAAIHLGYQAADPLAGWPPSLFWGPCCCSLTSCSARPLPNAQTPLIRLTPAE